MDSQNLNPQSQIKHLSPEETQNPHLVIEHFFQNYHLSECRSLLREVLHQAFSGYTSRESMNPSDMLHFWEELEKVTEAIYLIAQQKAGE